MRERITWLRGVTWLLVDDDVRLLPFHFSHIFNLNAQNFSPARCHQNPEAHGTKRGTTVTGGPLGHVWQH